MKQPFLLIEVGNTNTEFALADERRIRRVTNVPTPALRGIPFARSRYQGAILASVVPAATRKLGRWLPQPPLVVRAGLELGIGVRYPRPREIGADRLANAVAVVALYGAPAIVIDFGTAVTFDVVNARQEYIGGVIAPGIAALTEYLHRQTALLPCITPREPSAMVGQSTVGAMQVGTVIGYRGLVKEILAALRREPGMRRAVVVATGGYGGLIARRVPGIQHVNPRLTLEGMRIIYLRNTRKME